MITVDVTGMGWVMVAAAALVGVVVVEYLARWWIRAGKGYYVFTPGLRLRLHPDAPDVFAVRVEPWQVTPLNDATALQSSGRP